LKWGTILNVGIFHPYFNACGGAECVAANIIHTLKSNGHKVVILTNEKIDYERAQKLFGFNLDVDLEITFPLEFFRTTDIHNVYTDCIRTLLLKTKCDILVDTYSNAVLPGVDVAYIHFPLEGMIPRMGAEENLARKLKNTYYLPYLSYERAKVKRDNPLVFGNSGYTLNAIRQLTGTSAKLLYPPIQRKFFNYTSSDRSDLVVSVARITPKKNLTQIPYIASLTDKRIRFLIVGIKESQPELDRIQEEIDRLKVSGQVQVMTNVPHGELLNILSKSKVYLHLTQGEHFGMAIAEAMASGCVPVVHNSGGPIEFVPDSQRFNNLEEAAEKIERTICEWSVDLSEHFTRRAEEFSEESFSEKFMKAFNLCTCA
jgi:glycosyltransferase involved in cell wall biosynthesis